MSNTPTTKPRKSKSVRGRPTVMTPEVIGKIEQAAALDASVEEMAFYGGIHRDTLYAYLKENKAFSDRIEELRNKPILKARQTVVNGLEEPSGARWYLERKRKTEFGGEKEFAIVAPEITLIKEQKNIYLVVEKAEEAIRKELEI